MNMSIIQGDKSTYDCTLKIIRIMKWNKFSIVRKVLRILVEIHHACQDMYNFAPPRLNHLLFAEKIEDLLNCSLFCLSLCILH